MPNWRNSAKFAIAAVGVSVVAWLSAVLVFTAVLTVFEGRVPRGDVRFVVFWSGLAFAVFLPVLYFPVLIFLAPRTESASGLVLRISVCAFLGIVPAIALAVPWGSAAFFLFSPVFAFAGIVLTLGHQRFLRRREPMESTIGGP